MRSRLGFLTILFSMLFFRIINDDGPGADESDDIGDFEIEDDENLPAKELDVPEKKEEQFLQDKEIEELKAFKEQIEAERATNEAVSALVEKYPDFNASKIAEYLGDIAKNKGENEAEKLNNPLGWENIYLTNFKKNSSLTPNFDRGRGETKEPYDFKKGFEKAYNGDKDSIADLLENSKG